MHIFWLASPFSFSLSQYVSALLTFFLFQEVAQKTQFVFWIFFTTDSVFKTAGELPVWLEACHQLCILSKLVKQMSY